MQFTKSMNVLIDGSNLLGDTTWAAALIAPIKEQNPGWKIAYANTKPEVANILPPENALPLATINGQFDPDITINFLGEANSSVHEKDNRLTLQTPKAVLYKTPSTMNDPVLSPHAEETGFEHIIDSFHHFLSQHIPCGTLKSSGFLRDFSEYKPQNIPDNIDFSKLVIIGVGATCITKTLTETKWVNIASSLAEQGYSVAIVGAPNYQAIVNSIIKCNSLEDKVISLVGKTSPSQLGWWLSKASVVAAGDTGIGHLAAALNVATVSAFPGRCCPEFVRPYGDKSRVVSTFSSFDTAAITPEEIVDEINNVFAECKKSLPV